jgi:hypothetical protein
MRALFCLLAFALTAPAFAAPDFNPAEWDRLVAMASASENRLPFDESELRYLAYIEPADKSAPHLAEYFSVVGVNGPDGFFAYKVSLVIEDWRKTPEGNSAIDQWIYEAGMSGDLYRLMHIEMIQAPGGRVLDYKHLPVGAPNDAAERERWLGFLSRWYGR